MVKKGYRAENDTLGLVEVPEKALWDPQTQRSKNNFHTGALMPIGIIRALLQVKLAAAQASIEAGTETEEKGRAIIEAIHQLLGLSNEELQPYFPLHIYQTGSGTQTNINVNEVVASLTNQDHPGLSALPNDDMNMGQSSNDTFPTAMGLMVTRTSGDLKSSVRHLIEELEARQGKYWTTVKVGRTHLQDAAPLTFGQGLSGYIATLNHDLAYINELEETLYELPIGGTAVGTGLNTAPDMVEDIAEHLSRKYGRQLGIKTNKFFGLTNHSGLSVVHGALKTLTADVSKIAQDIRFLGSGPRAGLGELNLPANEPGSSIMPGKVNPTQAGAVTMAYLRVFGDDTTIITAAPQGNFEMNVSKPVIVATFLESANVLSGTISSFASKMIRGLTVNKERMAKDVTDSLMTVTTLSPHIGYHEAATITQTAARENITLRTAVLKSGLVTKEQYDKWTEPIAMTNAMNTKPIDD